MPLFARAFAAGQVTDEHVEVLVKWIGACGLEAIRASEQTLLDLARQAGPQELAEVLQQLCTGAPTAPRSATPTAPYATPSNNSDSTSPSAPNHRDRAAVPLPRVERSRRHRPRAG